MEHSIIGHTVYVVHAYIVGRYERRSSVDPPDPRLTRRNSTLPLPEQNGFANTDKVLTLGREFADGFRNVFEYGAMCVPPLVTHANVFN